MDPQANLAGENSDPLVSPATQVFLGVTREEWFTIRHEGLRAQKNDAGQKRIEFPSSPYGDHVQVLLEMNFSKCLTEGIKVYQDRNGNYYAGGVTEDYVIPPSYILKALDAETAHMIFPEENVASSSAPKPVEGPPLKFQWQHLLPPEQSTKPRKKKG